MANFESIICWMLWQEDDHRSPGKIVNEGDGAGLTRLGLTQRWHQQDLPMDFFSTMPFDQAVAAAKLVYRKQYWNVLSGDLIDSDDIAAPLLSFAVNDTPLVSVKTLQNVLGIKEDGHIGPQTLSMLNSMDPDRVAKRFRAEWVNFYRNLVLIEPPKKPFLDGWINRANFEFPNPLVPPGLYGQKV